MSVAPVGAAGIWCLAEAGGEGMGLCNRANLKKAIYYFKRNGLRKTYVALRERLEAGKAQSYTFVPVTEQELERQRAEVAEWTEKPLVSILVPAYRTPERFLQELLDCLMRQSYPYWELVLADASEEDNSVRSAFEGWLTMQEVKRPAVIRQACKEEKAAVGQEETSEQEELLKKDDAGSRGLIRFVTLADNAGISENTNRALEYATGEYVGLLDHDDVLTPDALYEMVRVILQKRSAGIDLGMIYSDEDKCDGEGVVYYEPNHKEDFNLNLLLSNNYICHFLILKRELMQKLRFRKEYAGAQDYDLVLRCATELLPERERIAHVAKVLYHWRCHGASTAENPRSKSWAYEAGRKALEDFAQVHGYQARAVLTEHVGFYRLEYAEDFWTSRPKVGLVGGKIICKGRITGGRYDLNGTLFYENLPAAYSGYLQRAVLTQDAEVLDVRCLAVRPELRPVLEEVLGVPYKGCLIKDIRGRQWELFDASCLPQDGDIRVYNQRLSQAAAERGYTLLWYPDITKKLKV